MRRILCGLWSLATLIIGLGLIYLVATNQYLFTAYSTFVTAVAVLNLRSVALTFVAVLLVPLVWRLNRIARFKIHRMWHIWYACHGDKGSCQTCQALCHRCDSGSCSARH